MWHLCCSPSLLGSLIGFGTLRTALRSRGTACLQRENGSLIDSSVSALPWDGRKTSSPLAVGLARRLAKTVQREQTVAGLLPRRLDLLAEGPEHA